MSFGSRLKDRRESLAMKQSELAEVLDVTNSAISNYENGVSFPKADVLYKVFEALQCDANYLFQDEMGEMASSDLAGQSHLLDVYAQLNGEGQEKLLSYADDLVSTGKYIKNHPAIQTKNA